jgi:hypothetical protein
MPDETENKLEQVVNNAEKNAEVAKKLADQDQTLKNTPPDVRAETGDALDALAAKAPDKKPNADPKASADDPKPDDKVPDTEKKATGEGQPAAPVVDPAVEAHKKRADEIFKDSPSLPSNASPKSTEAFSSVKIRAAQEISTREAEIDKLKKEKAELEAKLKDPIPSEVTKELEDHRTWRAKLDIETDPKFKAFDKTVSESHEFIYAQLLKSPAVTPDIIEKIKSHGGPENVQMEKIFEAVKDPTIQRLVESKMADAAMAKFAKEQAIKSAKENVNQYLTERQKAWEQAATAHNTATKSELDKLISKVEWMKDKPLTGTDDEKKAAEAHNAVVKQIHESLSEGLNDDTPEMRAIMLAGMANLIYLQKLRESEKGAIKAEQDAHAATKAALAEATASLEKLKKASTSRLRESAAPPGGKLPEVKKDLDIRSAGEALDDLAKRVVEERNRVGAVG